MKSRRLFLALIPLLAVQAFADIYSWTDKNGVKHFSNDPPPAGEAVTDVIVMKESAVEEQEPEKTEPQSEPSQENPQNKGEHKVYIYVEPESEGCDQALAFFNQNKIPYTKFDITASEDEQQRFKNVQGTSVPLIFIDQQRMDGWNEQVARDYLGMKKELTPAEKAAQTINDIN
jgi:glutaredoxin